MRMKQTAVPWDVDQRWEGRFIAAFYVEESAPNESRLSLFQDVMDWCYERFGPGQSVVSFKTRPNDESMWLYHAVACIIVSQPDHAIEFKLRWC